jgi:hypothetical protein
VQPVIELIARKQTFNNETIGLNDLVWLIAYPGSKGYLNQRKESKKEGQVELFHESKIFI